MPTTAQRTSKSNPLAAAKMAASVETAVASFPNNFAGHNGRAKSNDPQLLHDTVWVMDQFSQTGFERIKGLARLAMTSLKAPKEKWSASGMEQTMLTILDIAEDMENCINVEAEKVGCHYQAEGNERAQSPEMRAEIAARCQAPKAEDEVPEDDWSAGNALARMHVDSITGSHHLGSLDSLKETVQRICEAHGWGECMRGLVEGLHESLYRMVTEATDSPTAQQHLIAALDAVNEAGMVLESLKDAADDHLEDHCVFSILMHAAKFGESLTGKADESIRAVQVQLSAGTGSAAK